MSRKKTRVEDANPLDPRDVTALLQEGNVQSLTPVQLELALLDTLESNVQMGKSPSPRREALTALLSENKSHPVRTAAADAIGKLHPWEALQTAKTPDAAVLIAQELLKGDEANRMVSNTAYYLFQKGNERVVIDDMYTDAVLLVLNVVGSRFLDGNAQAQLIWIFEHTQIASLKRKVAEVVIESKDQHLIEEFFYKELQRGGTYAYFLLRNEVLKQQDVGLLNLLSHCDMDARDCMNNPDFFSFVNDVVDLLCDRGKLNSLERIQGSQLIARVPSARRIPIALARATMSDWLESTASVTDAKKSSQ